jgi:threonine synthase
MNHVLHLRCLVCGDTYQPDDVRYVCPKHGNEGILDVVYDYDVIRRNISREALAGDSSHPTIWRYKALLPVSADRPTPPLAVGGTPLYKTDRLAAQLGLKHVWVKDDGRNPTASFKDRASAIAVMKAQELSAEIVTTASTGNAAAALAGICASVGQKNVIFVPKSAPEAKIAQLLVYGSTVLLVDGTYGDAFDLCLESAETYTWYNRNTGYNPYMTEGKKTVSFEIAEQLGWDAPDVVFVSVGDGCIIGGVHKGFKDLQALGWIEKMPRIIGVQAEGSNYLTEAWQNGEDILTKPAIAADTVADSISAGLPRDRIKALAAVSETNGVYIAVSDTQILAAIPALAQACGVFAEPAGAAAYAGLQKAVAENLVGPADRIVVINTGNGLKDIRGAMQSLRVKPYLIRPKIEDVKAIFN